MAILLTDMWTWVNQEARWAQGVKERQDMSLCEGVVSYIEGKFHLFMVSLPYQAPTANWLSYQDGLRQSYLENAYGADLLFKRHKYLPFQFRIS